MKELYLAQLKMSYPTGLRELLRDLAFYNLTKENEKICFSTSTTVSSTSPYGWFYRRWYGEGTTKLIDKTTTLIDRSVEALRMSEWGMYRPDIFAHLIAMDSTIRKQLEVYDTNNAVKAELNTSRHQISHILKGMTSDEKKIVDVLKTQSNFEVGSISPPDRPVSRREDREHSSPESTDSTSTSPDTPSASFFVNTSLSTQVESDRQSDRSDKTSLQDEDLLSIINQSNSIGTRPGSAPIPIRR